MKRLFFTILFIAFLLPISYAQRSVNIVFIGNSITYGALQKNREVTAPPAQCAHWLSAQEGIDSVYFRNCGRSGRTTYHFLPRKEDVIPAGDKTCFGDVVAKTRDLTKEHPNLQLIFNIMLGTNDAVERKHNSHTTPDNYVRNLEAIIDSLLKLWPEAHVVLNKPIWNSSDYVTQGGSVATKKSLKLLSVYADRLKDVANRYKMGQVHLGDFDAYDYFEKNWKTDIFEEKDSRGKSYWLHPNEKGAEKLAEYWGKAIIKIPAPASASFRQEYGDARKTFVETIATPDHADSRYGLGQPAALRVVAREGGVPLEGTKIYYKVGPEMFLPEHYDSTAFVGGEALLQMGTMQEPGFLACQYEFRVGGKTYKDLVKVAYEPEQIKTFTPMPKDFEAFWQKALKEARKVPLEPEYFDVPDATNDKFVTKLVRLHVGKEKWMQGYLTLPLTSHSSPLTSKYPVVLCPPGAGSQKIYPSDYFPKEGCIYLKIEIHDNDQRLSDEAYAEERKKCEGYMSRGMDSRDTYYYKDVYVGCARVVDFLCSLPEWDGRNVIVTGGSQGGALTIITAALNEKVTMCAPFYPALCDVMGFLHHRAGGWPKFFSGFYKDGRTMVSDEKATETLQYFDVVNFARLLKVPTFMSWGYNDDTCSPTSVWAAWNEIKAPKEKDITPTSGHWRFPSSQAKCLEWMKRGVK